MEARGEERRGGEGHDFASREERPCWAGVRREGFWGVVEEEATNYLVDSVNWAAGQTSAPRSFSSLIPAAFDISLRGPTAVIGGRRGEDRSRELRAAVKHVCLHLSPPSVCELLVTPKPHGGGIRPWDPGARGGKFVRLMCFVQRFFHRQTREKFSTIDL